MPDQVGLPPDERLRVGGADRPSERAARSSLALTVDDLLTRLDALRDRPAVSASITAVAAVALVVGWWLAQPDPGSSLDERIPMAGSALSDAQSAVGRRGAEAATETEAPGSAGSLAGTIAEVSPLPPTSGPEPFPADEAEPDLPAPMVVVHVSGQVRRQGLVELEFGSRIADAIEAAGGPLVEADIHRLNLAELVLDGSHIRVPAVDEQLEDPLVQLGAGSGSLPDGPAGSLAGTTGSVGSLININTADAATLELLPGVGPATSAAIVRWRNENGGFATVGDLLLVPGIGPAKLAAIADLVTS